MEIANRGLTGKTRHIHVSHMKQTNIRELKHSTGKILTMVESGESVEVLRRRKPVAVLSPPGRDKAIEAPDFAARLREIHGEKALDTTGTELIGEARGER